MKSVIYNRKNSRNLIKNDEAPFVKAASDDELGFIKAALYEKVSFLKATPNENMDFVKPAWYLDDKKVKTGAQECSKNRT